MFKEANNFLYELYQRMPLEENHPYFSLSPEQFHKQFNRLFEFYYDNYERLLPPDKDVKILDIGFGFAMFMVYAKLQGYNNIYGVEFDKNQVKNAISMGFHAELVASLIDYLKDNLNQFDVIHISSVVEHFPKYDLIKIFDLLYGVLKPGGKIIVVVPNIAAWRGDYIRYFVLGHEIGFSEISLEQILNVCNFKSVKVLGSTIKFRPRTKHILMRFFQAVIDKIIGFIDYVYLGSDRPKHRSKFIFGTGYKK